MIRRSLIFGGLLALALMVRPLADERKTHPRWILKNMWSEVRAIRGPQIRRERSVSVEEMQTGIERYLASHGVTLPATFEGPRDGDTRSVRVTFERFHVERDEFGQRWLSMIYRVSDEPGRVGQVNLLREPPYGFERRVLPLLPSPASATLTIPD